MSRPSSTAFQNRVQRYDKKSISASFCPLFCNHTDFLGFPQILICGKRRNRDNYIRYRVSQSLIADSDDKYTLKIRCFANFFAKKSAFFYLSDKYLWIFLTLSSENGLKLGEKKQYVHLAPMRKIMHRC